MLRVAVVAGGQLNLQTLPRDFDIYVGIDGGCLKVIDASLPLTLAVGDFDSIASDQLSDISQRADEVIQASRDKNDTDTELGLIKVFERWPQATVHVYGAFGGRLDHLLANVFLPSHPDLAPYMEQIKLIDDQNLIEYRPSGSHMIEPVTGMAYLAFMTSEMADLTILGAKYPLTPRNFFKKKIYTSNEFLSQPIEVSASSGYIIMIHSTDRI